MLRGRLSMPQGTASAEAWHARFAARTTMLVQRLEAEPDVAAVTYAQDFPGQERYVPIDAEGHEPIDARSTRVATNLFDVFDVRLLAGRGFVPADARPGATAVIVDQAFANELSPGANVVGRRIRYSQRGRDGAVEYGPWLEIVGVVPAFADSFTAPN